MAGQMRNATRAVAAFALALFMGAPALAGCPAGMREYRGSIRAVNASKLFVQSRLDDDIGFARAPETRVAGRKSSWDSLAVGDHVAVCWRFDDQPRKAVTVTVTK